MKNSTMNGNFVLALALFLAAQFGLLPSSHGTGLNPQPDPVKFGADVGNFKSNENPGMLTMRMGNLKTDKMVTIRYFVDNFHPDSVNLPPQLFPPQNNLSTFCSTAFSNGVVVIPVFDPLSYYPSHSSTKYANEVITVLEAVLTYIPGTIIGVYLGNEPDGLHQRPNDGVWYLPWNPNAGTDTAAFEGAAVNFANYYYEAANRIRNHTNSSIKNLTIYSYGLEMQETLTMNPPANTGVAFLNKFISEVRGKPNGTSRLPNVFTIHGYTGKRQPEETTGSGKTLWDFRLTRLSALTAQHGGYLPKFAVTEYGFSQQSGTAYAVLNSNSSDTIGPNENTQAIYYLRRLLMDATTVSSAGNRWWDYNLYWQHCFNDELYTNAYTGWFHGPTLYNNKKIRKVAQKVFTVDSASPGLSGNYITWKKLESISTTPSTERLMTCMWISPSGVKWGAIWRIESSPPQTRVERFWNPPANTQVFEFVQSTEPGKAYLYKFNFSGATPTFQYLDERSPSSSGSTRTYLLDNLVDANPLFLRIN